MKNELYTNFYGLIEKFLEDNGLDFHSKEFKDLSKDLCLNTHSDLIEDYYTDEENLPELLDAKKLQRDFLNNCLELINKYPEIENKIDETVNKLQNECEICPEINIESSFSLDPISKKIVGSNFTISVGNSGIFQQLGL